LEKFHGADKIKTVNGKLCKDLAKKPSQDEIEERDSVSCRVENVHVSSSHHPK
jgi:hypothetical protein